MQVIIQDLVSSVRADDGEAMLAPETLRRVVEAVMRAMREERALERRVSEETAVDNSYEATRDWR